MKIAVDVMGFENEISEAVEACRLFTNKNAGVQIILVGNQNQISPLLKNPQEFEIVHANEVVTQDDTILSLRTKKDTSMAKAIDLVNEAKADGVLSAGNSAIYVFLTYQKFGLIEGVKKVGFMPFVPTFKGPGFNLLDVGASIECDGEDLYNLALMGNIAAQARGVTNPRVGIINIGTEKHKGHQYHRDADALLKHRSDLNYLGFIEPKNLLDGICDVAVADGFSGNLVLKTLEGTAKGISTFLLSKYKKPYNFLGFLLALPVLLSFKKKFDYKNNAGAFVLGVKKIAVKTHGSADKKQFYSALRMLKQSIDFDLLNKIQKEFKNGK